MRCGSGTCTRDAVGGVRSAGSDGPVALCTACLAQAVTVHALNGITLRVINGAEAIESALAENTLERVKTMEPDKKGR